MALLSSISRAKEVEVAMLCDVDSNVLKERLATVKAKSARVKGEVDFRKMIASKDIDAVFISSPDHTHSPFAIYALQAGKHVYVEKPVSHNPQEGEWLIEAQKKYKKVVQVGNQQRSAPTSIQAVKDIKEGKIGEVYKATSWYGNSRSGIGKGQKVPVPAWLQWDLWQGPVPRRPYQDNIVHYNWHWFKHWGTGEINNNGLHELDVCRWAMGVDYPSRVTSAGGRYFFDDDWEFFDTQDVTFEFPGNKTIQWLGNSCNNIEYFNRGRGSLIQGTKGRILLDRNAYITYDLKGAVISEMQEAEPSGTTDPLGEGALVDYHVNNFFDAIRTGAAQNSPVDDINKSNLLCHLGNIAQFNGGVLEVDPRTGRCHNNKVASEMWSRDYEPGWAPVV